jgi:hypothetical protein
VTVKVAVPAASLTVMSSMEKVGATSLSVMEAVPVAPDELVTVPVMAPVERVKDSVDSLSESSVVEMRSCREVCPAAMVTGPETVLQEVPPSVETSSVVAAAVSVPMVAVPLVRDGVKEMAWEEGLERLTVKTVGDGGARGIREGDVEGFAALVGAVVGDIDGDGFGCITSREGKCA